MKKLLLIAGLLSLGSYYVVSCTPELQKAIDSQDYTTVETYLKDDSNKISEDDAIAHADRVSEQICRALYKRECLLWSGFFGGLCFSMLAASLYKKSAWQHAFVAAVVGAAAGGKLGQYYGKPLKLEQNESCARSVIKTC